MISTEVAAVVIGRNEGKRLIECLKTVIPNVSCTIYVDSGSTDDSIEAAEGLGAHVVKLDETQPFTAARARNEGFAAVNVLKPGIPLIQFVDGDCQLVDDWLVKAVPFMNENTNVAVVCGRRREKYPSASVYNRLCDLEWDTPIGEASACGGDSLVRAASFKAVGGFNANLIAGEEPEFCLRLRATEWRIWRLDAEMTRHDAAILRFVQWWIRSVRSGYGLAEVCRLHWNSSVTLWKRELIRAIFWAGLLPGFICLAALFHPPSLAAILIYPAQICRIAMIRGATSSLSWTYAAFVTLAKFAELQGILRFYWRRLRGRTVELIEYKQASSS